MARSSGLRASDWRAIAAMAGEARELGDDAFAWRDHWLAGLAKLTGTSMGHFGEIRVGRDFRPQDLGVAVWGYQEKFVDLATVERQLVEFRTQPDFFASLSGYFRIQAEPEHDGVSLTRTDFIADRDWYGSTDHLVVQSAFGVEHVLFCHHTIAEAAPGEVSGMILHRARGLRDYSSRERAIVREAHDAIVPLVGRALARFHEPSPRDLGPSVRQVLAALLEGDSDKQVAARLHLSPHTVNQHTKRIYKHFGVNGRSELLARWLRRGWGARFTWTEPHSRETARIPYTVRNRS